MTSENSDTLTIGSMCVEAQTMTEWQWPLGISVIVLACKCQASECVLRHHPTLCHIIAQPLIDPGMAVCVPFGMRDYHKGIAFDRCIWCLPLLKIMNVQCAVTSNA